ncbi:Hypothetical predicted protein [Olea europaea subsp. europaea]|uniref:DUF1985 domain-containing protein n=1 Tax=Olea europaea subsp. europaea TaxID=158383 RepID=A0A8S0PVQ2_OLEEU|nr:Hypothetical predicted protein [Olea europaea subsp. europaea]
MPSTELSFPTIELRFSRHLGQPSCMFGHQLSVSTDLDRSSVGHRTDGVCLLYSRGGKVAGPHFVEEQLEVNELWFNVQGNMMRFGLQEYTLVTGLRCGVFPEGDEFDRVLERRRLKKRVGYWRLLHEFRGFWAKKFLKATRRQEKEVTYTIHGFPFAMQVWAYEAVPEIGERFGQRVGERMPRLLRWSARKQPQHPTLHPTDAEAEQQYFSTLVPYDDPPVPVLDEIARNVVGPQFNASHGGSGSGGQLVRQESYDRVSSGGSGEDETFGDEGVDTEESGEGASERSSVGADTCREQTGASSTPPATHVSSPVRGPTMETRSVGTSGSGLTKEEVEELLFDQRILFEMRLRTIKLEIEQHVTSECKKLGAFFATLMAPPALTPIAAAMPADTEAGVSGSILQEIHGEEMGPSPDEQDMRADTRTAHVQDGGDIAARPDNVHDPLPVVTDEQIDGGQIEPIFAVSDLNGDMGIIFLIFFLPVHFHYLPTANVEHICNYICVVISDGGAMEPSHAAPSNDADLQGCDVTDGDGDLSEIPVPASVAEAGHGVPMMSRRSARVRRPAPAARTPYTRAAKRTKK